MRKKIILIILVLVILTINILVIKFIIPNKPYTTIKFQLNRENISRDNVFFRDAAMLNQTDFIVVGYDNVTEQPSIFRNERQRPLLVKMNLSGDTLAYKVENENDGAYNSVVTTPNGFITVGDSIIAQYDNNLNLIDQKEFVGFNFNKIIDIGSNYLITGDKYNEPNLRVGVIVKVNSNLETEWTKEADFSICSRSSYLSVTTNSAQIIASGICYSKLSNFSFITFFDTDGTIQSNDLLDRSDSLYNSIRTFSNGDFLLINNGDLFSSENSIFLYRNLYPNDLLIHGEINQISEEITDAVTVNDTFYAIGHSGNNCDYYNNCDSFVFGYNNVISLGKLNIGMNETPSSILFTDETNTKLLIVGSTHDSTLVKVYPNRGVIILLDTDQVNDQNRSEKKLSLYCLIFFNAIVLLFGLIYILNLKAKKSENV